MSGVKPFPPQNHTQPTCQPTCNIISGGLSPFNSPHSPQLSPFNSPHSPQLPPLTPHTVHNFPPLTPHTVRNFPPLTPHRVRSPLLPTPPRVPAACQPSSQPSASPLQQDFSGTQSRTSPPSLPAACQPSSQPSASPLQQDFSGTQSRTPPPLNPLLSPAFILTLTLANRPPSTLTALPLLSRVHILSLHSHCSHPRRCCHTSTNTLRHTNCL